MTSEARVVEEGFGVGVPANRSAALRALELNQKFSLELPRGRTLEFPMTPGVMGIINTTPDSFSDGGDHLAPDKAIQAAMRMVDDGASIIDVGGESTRPGAEPVPLEIELDRVLPVIEGIRKETDAAISIDTVKAEVARAALDSGADIVNDVSALRMDPHMKDVVKSSNAPVILMHMRGTPRTMQDGIHYENLIEEIRAELSEWIDEAVRNGIDRTRILVDPGIGFGKTFEHNVEILGNAAAFRELGPVVIGASRKGFIGSLTRRAPGPDRAAGSIGAVAAAVLGGAAIVRVHDVRDTVDFLKVFLPTLEAM